MVRGEDKNQGEGYIFKTEIFQIIYLTTCTFQNDSASVGKSPGPYCGKIPHFQAEMFPIGYLTLSVSLSVWLAGCLSDCLAVCLSVWLSVCLSVCLYVYMSV